jgi:cytochrome c
MIARAGIIAILAVGLAACGGNTEPAADTAETTTAVAAVAKTGEQIFKSCSACHSITKGGPNGIGPNLHGIVGRKVASAAGYTYSAGMTAKGGVWDDAALDAYIAAPAKTVSGTKMMYAGLKDAGERKALIEYLATQK